jgi:RNA polymerase sigma-70 factor (ECF subfamily)
MERRTNADWVAALKSGGVEQTAALSDLSTYLRRAAMYALRRHRAAVGSLSSSQVAQLAEDCAQESVVAILAHLDEFRGASRFTTWAFAFAVNAALVVARRERWRQVPLEEVLEAAGLDPRRRSGEAEINPHRRAAEVELMTAVLEAIERDLSERQRSVLRAVVFEEVPLDEVARYWNSNRNAVYKVLHDARRKLKAVLGQRGFGAGDIVDLVDRVR